MLYSRIDSVSRNIADNGRFEANSVIVKLSLKRCGRGSCDTWKSSRSTEDTALVKISLMDQYLKQDLLLS